MGRNGTGKSTLLRVLSGLMPPTNGTVELEGRSVSTLPASERARHISFLTTDSGSTLSLSAEETVSLGRLPHTAWHGKLGGADRALAVQALALFDLLPLRDRVTASLSDGERQRVMMARIAAQGTPVVLLDEPLSHLDVPWKTLCLRKLRELCRRGATVIATLHEPNLAARHADFLLILDGEGGFAWGTPGGLIADGTLERAFSTRDLVFDPRTMDYREPGTKSDFLLL
jgi:iron complex transport system ATP-binding protein